MIPNLYVDHVSPVPLVRQVDVCNTMTNNADRYKSAMDAIGMTRSERIDATVAFCEGDAWYGPLPRHIQAMAGHRRNGTTYALHHVVVPANTMGWTVALPDGLIVYIPRVCGNPSINRGRRAPKSAVYVLPPWHDKGTPVSLAIPPAVLESQNWSHRPGNDYPVSAPVTGADTVQEAPPERKSSPWLLLPFLAPVASWFAPKTVPPCSEGSNTVGACR